MEEDVEDGQVGRAGLFKADTGRFKGEMEEKSKSKVFIIIIIVIAVILAVVGLLVFKNSPAQRLKHQLSLGERHLTEQEYDEAVLAFEKAIEIEPMSEEAYIGLANAYIGKEDYENALEAVERGIAAVGETEELLTLKAQLEEQLNPTDSESKDGKQADSSARAVDVDWTFDLYDLWKYDLFGKDINDWTVDELGQYLIDNGFTRYQREDGSWSDQNPKDYYEEPRYEFGYSNSGVFMHGGEISIYLDPQKWIIKKEYFSPSIEAEGISRHYDFLPLPDLTKDDFINMLSRDMQIKTFSVENFSFNDGIFQCSSSEIFDLWGVINNLEDGESPTLDTVIFTFKLEADNSRYGLMFDADTGELVALYRRFD